MNLDTITVFGLGYIGLPTAAAIAAQRKRVLGVDINEDTVRTINEGKIHIVEPELDVAVQAAVLRGYLKASLTAKPADAFLIAVPTPFKDGHQPDLSYIEAAARSLAPMLEPGNLVVLESTSPVGTTEKLAGWLAEARPDLSFPPTHGPNADIRIAYCPERVLPGRIMHELIENDRIIGGLTPACAQAAATLYESFVRGQCLQTDARTAEMCKLTENAARDVSIAFANELSIVCDRLAIDVWELISLANRHPRIDILQPGPGVGGHCIAVDPWFIISQSPEHTPLMQTAREINENKPAWVLDKIEAAMTRFLEQNPGRAREDITVACFGLAFKANIDDLRESPAVTITQRLAERHTGTVLAVEPHVEALPEELARAGVRLETVEQALLAADIHVLLVDHHKFKSFNPARAGKISVDTRGIWPVSQPSAP